MPFGPWSSFTDCVSEQKKKYKRPGVAEKVCGKLQATLPEKKGSVNNDDRILGVFETREQCEKAVKNAGIENAEAICNWLEYQGDKVPDLLRYSKAAVLTAAPSGVDDFVNIIKVNLLKQADLALEAQGRGDGPTRTPLQNTNDDEDREESTFEDYGMDWDSCVSDQVGNEGKSRDDAQQFCDGLEQDYQRKLQAPWPPDTTQHPSAPAAGGQKGGKANWIDVGSGRDVLLLNESAKKAKPSAADDQEDVADKGADETTEGDGGPHPAVVNNCVKMKMNADDSLTESDARDECMEDLKTSSVRSAKRKQRLVETYFEEIRVGSIVEKFKDANSQRLFIKAFLLDASTNINRWGINKDYIENNVSSFLGKPLVLTSNYDHPVVQYERDLGHAMAYQELFRIGNIISIEKHKDPKTGHDVYYAIIEITEPNAKEAFSSGRIPLYVSPAIAKLNPAEEENEIQTWTGLHLAIVDDPAYTVRKATITGQCGGDEHQCLLQLRKAHVEKNGGKENCGFCNKKVLLARAVPLDLYEDELRKLDTNAANLLIEEKAGVRIASVTIDGRQLEPPVVKDAVTVATIADPVQPAVNNVLEKTDTSRIENNGNTLPQESMSSSGNQVSNPNQNAVAPNSGNAATAVPPVTATTGTNQPGMTVNLNTGTPSPTVQATQQPVQQQPQQVQPQQQVVQQPQQEQPQQVAAIPQQQQQPLQMGAITYSSPQDPNSPFNAEITALKAQVNVLNQAVGTWKQDAETWRARASALEDALRRSEIERIITPQDIPNAQEREAQIKTFLDARVPATQVEIIYNNLKEISRKANGPSSVYTASQQQQHHAPLIHQPSSGYSSPNGVVSVRTAKREDEKSDDDDFGPYGLASQIVKSGGAP